MLYYGFFKDSCHGEGFYIETKLLFSSWNQLTGSYVLQDFPRWNHSRPCKCFFVWVSPCLSQNFPATCFHWNGFQSFITNLSMILLKKYFFSDSMQNHVESITHQYTNFLTRFGFLFVFYDPTALSILQF